MVDIEFIRKKHFVEHWSIREISRRLGLSRQAVRKALKDASQPHYRLGQARPRPVIGPYEGVIKGWLKEDKQAPAKQRHTAKRIFERLCQEYGFQGSEVAVVNSDQEVGHPPG